MQQRIWAGIYPSHSRGRLLGIVGSGRSLAAMAALLAFTAAAGAGWLAIVAVVALVGVVSGFAPSRLTMDADDEVRSYGAGRIGAHRVAPAHAAPHHGRAARLRQRHGGPAGPHRHGAGGPPRPVASGTSPWRASWARLATVLTFGAWGRLAGRTSALVTMTSGVILGTLAMAVFAVAPDFALLLLASALLGAANAAIDVSWPLLIADHAAPRRAGRGRGRARRHHGPARTRHALHHRGAPSRPGCWTRPAGCSSASPWPSPAWSCTCGCRASTAPIRLAAGRAWPCKPGRGRSSEARAPTPSRGRPAPARWRRPARGSPVMRRSRLMRSTMAGWVLKSPLALSSSFLMGLTM